MNTTQPTHKYVEEINELPKREVEIKVAIPWEEVEKKREIVMKRLKGEVEVKGFRKGEAPDKKVIEKVGEEAIVQEMAQEVLQDVYPEILKEEEIDAIGRPSVSLTKVAAGNPLQFSIKMARMPEVTLPDYTSIAKEVNKNEEKPEVTEKDVEDTINHLREQWVKRDKYQEALKKVEGEEKVDPASIEVSEDELPELSDEFVKQLGDFKDVKDFKQKLKENLLKEKEMQLKEKQRIALIEAVHEKTEADIPELLVDSELQKMVEQFRMDVERAGFKLDEYLKQTGKTLEDMKKEWRADAQKRAETQLILNKIAEEEKITPKEEDVKKEVEKIMKMYDDADEFRARTYVRTILTNEEVFKFLEGAK